MDQFDGVVGVSAYVTYFTDYYRALGMPDDNFAIALLRGEGGEDTAGFNRIKIGRRGCSRRSLRKVFQARQYRPETAGSNRG